MKFGVVYRDNKNAAWKFARYPLNASREQAQRLIEWLRKTPLHKDTELRTCSVEIDDLRKAVNES